MRSPSLGFSILITSAPISPRMRVQWGPETDTSSARTLTPDSASASVLFGFINRGEQVRGRGVGALPDHYRTRIIDHYFPFLLNASRAHFDDAPLRLGFRFALFENFGFGIERVAREKRIGQLDFVPS